MQFNPTDRVYLCGRLVVLLGGERLEGRLPGRQGQIVFAALARHRGRGLSREELARALWGDAPPDAADSALSALLSRLRRAVGPHRLDGRAHLRLDLPRDTWIDLDAADDALHRAESAVARGAFAEAWSPARVAVHVAARGFLTGAAGRWVERERGTVARMRLRALEVYAEACLALRGTELATAERAARTLVDLAPYRESGHRLLMRALVARGNPAEALMAYEELRRLLRTDLGVGPGVVTRRLHAEILTGR
ncbi:AfsR/SARP family transcriptional regulator [Pseudonocardia sp.]|uniref:AfsR/SARP family transcriptional regulator n=1 Tax=Pseudonocardia sp. TaxID=60912 RepID=UPI003D0F28D4